MKYYFGIFFLVLGSLTAQAATPDELLATYRTEAGVGFQPSALRGREFFLKRFAVSEKLPSCSACHTDNPIRAGRHVVTDKVIEPLAPAANGARLTDTAKTEKWFRRNCKEVVGRECSVTEKADFIAFLMGVRP